MMTLSVPTIVLLAQRDETDKITRQTPGIFPPFHSVAISFRNIRNSAFFWQRVTLRALQMVNPRLAQSRGSLSRVEGVGSLAE